MADVNGFTLMDMVSYNGKHNEANGEGNQDGTDYNQSWNCGGGCNPEEEGSAPAQKAAAKRASHAVFESGSAHASVRRRVWADEKGNNNSYRQDNEISGLTGDFET